MSASVSPAPAGTPASPSPAPQKPLRTAAAPVDVVVVGDSLSTGYGTSASTAWPVLLQKASSTSNQPLNVIDAAQNGSGYVATGDGGGTFLSEVQGSVTRTAGIVVFFGSENDMGTDPGSLRPAVSAAVALAKAKAPEASIVVVGPPSYTDSPEPERVRVRDEIQAAARAAGAVFVDPIQDHWISGEANELIGPDGDHPSVAGQQYLQAMMRSIVLANLPPGTGPAHTRAVD